MNRTTGHLVTARFRTKILDFRGLDPNIILVLRGGILLSTGDLLENLNQHILAGMLLVGRLGIGSLCGLRSAAVRPM